MEEIDEYRARVVAALAEAKDADGNLRLSPEQATALAKLLDDNALADGMLFNTPEEVAELLLESGLE